MTATLIVIEGTDSCGKETQTKMLYEALKFRGFSVVRFEVPFKDMITHKIIYSMLKNGSARRHPHTFQMVQFLNKKLFERSVLGTALKKNDYVLLDRWKLSSEVYGQIENVAGIMTDIMSDNLKDPDYTIVLAGEPHKNHDEDTYERDKVLQSRARFLYEKWARKNPINSSLIDPRDSRTTVHCNIMTALETAGIV